MARIPIGTQLTDALRFTPQEEISRVAEYLMRKEGIDKNDPSSQQFITAFETTAKEDYKHRGVIRNRSYPAGEQARRWQAEIDHWTNDRDTNTGSIIRRQRSGLQGTIEAMQAVLPCIKKGCLADPWDMAAMHMDTHLQKKPGCRY